MSQDPAPSKQSSVIPPIEAESVIVQQKEEPSKNHPSTASQTTKKPAEEVKSSVQPPTPLVGNEKSRPSASTMQAAPKVNKVEFHDILKYARVNENPLSKYLGIDMDLERRKNKVTASITKAVLVEGHHEYLLTGTAFKRKYEAFKRFREFHAFHSLLEQAWPGIYIPPVPRKKLFGYKKAAVVNERTAQLDSFCKSLTFYSFLADSEEVEQFLENKRIFYKTTYPKVKSEELLKKYINAFSVNMKMLKVDEVFSVKSLKSYNAYIQTVMPLLEKVQAMVEETKDYKVQNASKYSTIWTGLQSYENDCLTEYVHKINSKLVLSRSDNENIRQLLGYNEETIVAPFQEMELWIKQKMLELKAYTTSMESLETLMLERVRAIERKTAAEQKLATLRQKPGKEREANMTEGELFGLYKEVENLTAIINIAILYMTDIFLPLFKRRQLLLFYRILQKLFNSESTVIAKMAQAWGGLLTDKNLKHF